MGVHGDVLFADPLGIRKPKAAEDSRNGKTPGQQVNANTTGRREAELNTSIRSNASPMGTNDDVLQEEEQSWLGSWVSYFISGGAQCCSMRDRTRDAEAAKLASKTGRPPRGRFPPPRGAADAEDSPSPQALRGRQSDPVPQPAPKPVPRPSIGADRDDEDRVPSPPPRPAAPRPEQQRPEPPAVLKWHWPAWCLNFKAPTIEVFVIDEDTGEGRWLLGTPQSRVVDKVGNDAYLCAEYDWDGELFVEDFPPDRVRRRGHTSTVQELLSRQRAAAGQAALGSVDSIDATQRSVDDGGGLSRFLNETG